MKRERIKQEADRYRRALCDDILPFWLKHAPDRECGGYATCLDRDGSVYDHDKVCLWAQGRIAWTFSHMYNTLEPHDEWLDMAQRGVAFLREHGFAPDGSMYYALTRTGAPLQPAQDVFTELSTVLAYTEVARASRDRALHEEARRLFESVWARFAEPGRAHQGVLAETRPARLHGHSMITLNVIQELRRFEERPEDNARIEECIRIMAELHMRPQRKAVLELVGWDGGDLPGTLGRWINPGHMIEGGIFLIHEGQRRGREAWIRLGIDWIDWGFQHGWDKDFGGIYNDVDLEGRPVPSILASLRYDAKLWWQHAEALYALLLAYQVTGEDRFWDHYRAVRDYTESRFADPVHGEWIAALDRRGHPIGRAKGTDRKNTFHIGRNFLLCAQLAG